MLKAQGDRTRSSRRHTTTHTLRSPLERSPPGRFLTRKFDTVRGKGEEDRLSVLSIFVYGLSIVTLPDSVARYEIVPRPTIGHVTLYTTFEERVSYSPFQPLSAPIIYCDLYRSRFSFDTKIGEIKHFPICRPRQTRSRAPRVWA